MDVDKKDPAESILKETSVMPVVRRTILNLNIQHWIPGLVKISECVTTDKRILKLSKNSH